MTLYNSQYNFRFDTEEGILFYNARTGAVISLSKMEGNVLAEYLIGQKQFFRDADFELDLLNNLRRNGFLVPEHINELDEIQHIYWKARGETPVVLTITTTMDCNLGCYYCYENRTKEKLDSVNIHQIIDQLEIRVKNEKMKSLHVDWYGGEPLLNLQFLEAASAEIQAFCSSSSVSYHASIISNGTLWPDNIEAFVLRNKIRQVQISIDGMEGNHNKRRRLRGGYSTSHSSSFDSAIHVVDQLLDCVQVDLRFNIDYKNQQDIFPFIDFIESKGWFNRNFPLVFQPARISSYSEKSSFLEQSQLTIEEFDALRDAVARRLSNKISVEESEVPDGFPFPKTYVCAALANHSFVVGADTLVYRCGLQVGEKNRAVASLSAATALDDFPDSRWWEAFNPCQLASCSKCSFLPVCWGGCPKKHLEGDQHSLDEQSEYWRRNLYKKVVSYLKLTPLTTAPLSPDLQFRHGYN